MADQQLSFGTQAGDRGAVVSPCGRYRYHLWRTLSSVTPLRRVLFVMLNPSTADHRDDDPTIRKCLGFTKRWGFDRFDVANLFAWRATDPRELLPAQRSGQDIIGPENAPHLAHLARRATIIVAAWGAHAKPWAPYARKVLETLHERSQRGFVFCLGTTAAGFPCHPLVLSYETERVTYLGGANG